MWMWQHTSGQSERWSTGMREHGSHGKCAAFVWSSAPHAKRHQTVHRCSPQLVSSWKIPTDFIQFVYVILLILWIVHNKYIQRNYAASFVVTIFFKSQDPFSILYWAYGAPFPHCNGNKLQTPIFCKPISTLWE